MTPVERVQYMLDMEPVASEKDGAGIFVASRVDSAVKRKTLQEVLKKLKAADERPETVL